jgi:WhiB family redox-sensing transcriptional regulator
MSPPNLKGIVASPKWMADAECKQSDPELFYPDTGHSSRDGRAVCARCPVRAECLAYAIEHHERYGVWGGMSERQRRHMRETGGRSVNRTGTDARQGRTEVVRKLAATLSDSEIAKQLGCPRRTVMRVRALAGIPPARARYGGWAKT